MNTLQYIIGYQFDNHSIASEIDQKLSRVGFIFDHIHPGNALLHQSIGERILQQNKNFLLIITDNFLKDQDCIYKLYETILTAEKEARIFKLIIADGFVEDPVTGAIKETKTSLASVGDLLYYINYWQDKYLRQRKKHLGEESLSGESDHSLKKVREIASEIGDLLHKIRNLQPVSFDSFAEDDFRQFFEFSSHPEMYQDYRKMAEYDEQDARIERQVQNILQTREQGSDSDAEEDKSKATVLAGAKASEHNSGSYTQSEQSTESSSEASLLDELKTFKEELLRNSTQEPQHSEPESVDNSEESLPETILTSSEEMDKSKKLDKELTEKFGKLLQDKFDDEARTADTSDELQSEPDILQEYRNRLIKDPDNVGLRLELIKLLIQDTENFSETADHLEHVLVIDKNNTEAIYLIGQLSESVGEYKLARNYYRKLADIQPDYPNVFVRLAEITEAHFPEEQQELSDYYKKVFDHDTTNTSVLEKRAVLLYKSLNKPKKARKILQKLIKWNPQHPTAYYYLADIYYEDGQQEKALETLQKAREITARLSTADTSVHDLATPQSEKTQSETAHQPEISEKAELISKTSKKVTSYVCITGATSGIGKATAIKLASKGRNLILTGRRADRLEDLADEIEDLFDVQVEILEFDIRNIAETQKAIASLKEKADQIDVLINNAGLALGLSSVHEGSFEHWNTMIDTNIKGLLYMTRLITPSMVKRNQGHIINICSTAGKEVYPNGNVYCATKFAVDALTKSFRQDLYKYNIRVSQVAPGAVENTEFALVRYEGDEQKAKIYNDYNPLKADDVANIIDFIISQPAHVNIQDVLVMSTQQASASLFDRSGRKFNQE